MEQPVSIEHLYVYGAQFSVNTDHKPLIGIFSNHKQATARTERWKLRLMPYYCKLVYRPGRDAENPADYMSRHPSSKPVEQNIAEDYVNYVCNNAVPKAMTLEENKQETKEDAWWLPLTELHVHSVFAYGSHRAFRHLPQIH